MKSKIHEIAMLAGVSTATVSRALSRRGYVAERTRKKILEIAREQNYSPKQYKKRAISQHFSTVAVVVPDICNAYYMEVICGIERVMNSNGVDVIICNTDEDSKKEIRALTLLQQMNVAGVVAVPVSTAEQYNSDFLTQMNLSKTPVVLLDRDLPGGNIDGVFMDNFGSGYQSALALIRNGHRHIAIICGPITSTSAIARLEGYKKALSESGLDICDEYIKYGNFKTESGYAITKQLLQYHKKVTAIFASNSKMALGTYLALAESGCSVPDDMALISCGKIAEDLGNISTVIYPTYEIGEECARILLEKINNPRSIRKSGKKRTMFDMQLLLRGSEVLGKNRIKRKG